MTISGSGDISIAGCTSWANGDLQGTRPSDARLKTIIQPFRSVLDKLVKLQPVHFNYRAAEYPQYGFHTGQHSGLIAQQVERVIPEMVSADEQGFKRVDYGQLPYLLLEGVRELKAENDDLKRANNRKDEDIVRLIRQMQELRMARTQMRAFEARLALLESRSACEQKARATPADRAWRSGQSPTLAKTRF